MDKQLVKYRGMIRVDQEYSKSGMSDSEFAKHMSSADVTYTTAMVREWRRVLGIPNNEPASPREKEMAQQIADLKAVVLTLHDECLDEDDRQNLALNYPKIAKLVEAFK